MGTVLLQILVERHGLLHHFLVQHRGIEQMQLAVFPHGKAEMGDVETSLLAGDGNNVAIVDGLTQQGLILHHLLRDITETSTRNALLHLTDGSHKFRMLKKRLITLRMPAHIVHVHMLDSRERRIRRLDLRHDARFRILCDPLREVMDTAGVVIDLSMTITHGRERIQIVAPGEEMPIGTECQSRDRLHKCRTIQLTGIHHQPLIVIDLERMGHIGDIQEFPGEEEREVRGAGLTMRLVKQSADRQTIVLQIGHPLLSPSHAKECEECYQQEQTSFHFFFFLYLSFNIKL